MSDYVLFEQRGHVAIVTINRPDRMNALGHDVRNGLIDAFLKIRHEPSIRVAIITGAGDKAFSAGADLKEHNEIFQTKSYRVGPDYGALDEPPHSSIIAIETYKPLIAAVNGYALAGGCELTLACDIRIASENARFGLPEAKRGRGANFATVLLQYLIPRGIAMEMLFTGDQISAQDALRYGLVNRVVPLPARAFADRDCLGGKNRRECAGLAAPHQGAFGEIHRRAAFLGAKNGAGPEPLRKPGCSRRRQSFC